RIHGGGGTTAEKEGARKQRREDEDPDPDMGRAPALRRDEMLDDLRPERAGQVAARGRDRDGEGTMAAEPVRQIGDEGGEPRRGTRPDQEPMGQRKLPERVRRPGQAI